MMVYVIKDNIFFFYYVGKNGNDVLEWEIGSDGVCLIIDVYNVLMLSLNFYLDVMVNN